MDEWSEWKDDSCTSNCLEKSKGVLIARRICKHGTFTTANCEGLYDDLILCNDSILCNNSRKTIHQFTTMKCTKFSKEIPEVDKKSGWQAPHDAKEPWIACTIYCQKKSLCHQKYCPKQKPSYYAPRLEMLDFGINPYFPDGTWCHNNNGQDYYCRKHYCLPENYSFVKLIWGIFVKRLLIDMYV